MNRANVIIIVEGGNALRVVTAEWVVYPRDGPPSWLRLLT